MTPLGPQSTIVMATSSHPPECPRQAPKKHPTAAAKSWSKCWFVWDDSVEGSADFRKAQGRKRELAAGRVSSVGCHRSLWPLSLKKLLLLLLFYYFIFGMTTCLVLGSRLIV